MFKADAKTGDKTALASMNDKCASGTGATIDKCFLKVNAPPELVTTLRFEDGRFASGTGAPLAPVAPGGLCRRTPMPVAGRPCTASLTCRDTLMAWTVW